MLKSAHAPRIVVVSSGAHTLQPFRFDDLNYERESEWEGEKSYAESKVGGVLFCSALARKWQGRVEAISLTPGGELKPLTYLLTGHSNLHQHGGREHQKMASRAPKRCGRTQLDEF